MTVRGLSRARTWCALGIVAFTISGCHIHNATPDVSPTGSSSGSPTDNSNGLPSTDASTQFTFNNGGGSVLISSQGVGGTLAYPANNSVAVTGTLTLETNAPIGAPAPSGTPLIYFEVQLGSNVTFNTPFYISSAVFPDGYSTTGTYTETLYDETNNNSQIAGPLAGVVNGQTVTFPAPTSGSFTANASDTYLAIISS